jgi:hypothetical protein
MKRRDRKPSTPRPLSLAELAAAVGGARYGSGPDFDDKRDNTGNYSQ